MSPNTVRSYKDLIVWQRSVELVAALYELTQKFPKEELYGLTNHLRSAAISIPSNIAEGRYRGTKNHYLHFLRLAYGSGAEIETQIEIAKRLPKMKEFNYKGAESLLEEVMKMLYVMIRKLNPNNPSKEKGLSSGSTQAEQSTEAPEATG